MTAVAFHVALGMLVTLVMYIGCISLSWHQPVYRSQLLVLIPFRGVVVHPLVLVRLPTTLTPRPRVRTLFSLLVELTCSHSLGRSAAVRPLT